MTTQPKFYFFDTGVYNHTKKKSNEGFLSPNRDSKPAPGEKNWENFSEILINLLNSSAEIRFSGKKEDKDLRVAANVCSII